MKTPTSDRRQFLRASLATAGLPSLVGTATAMGPFLQDRVTALKGAQKSLPIITHEWFGDIEERLDFPNSWEINEIRMRGHNAPALKPDEIRQRLEKPIGTRSLRELAAGKKTAIILFDDLTQATPAYEVVPWVVSELKAAGISDENIIFLAAQGTHRTLELDEVQKKLGKDIPKRYVWMNHNIFDLVKDVGQTSFKNRIMVNTTFLAADLRVAICSIKIHDYAGYSGGSKMILPGITGIDTTMYNHHDIRTNNPTATLGKVFKNEVRLDMAEAARLARLDFSINLICSSEGGRRPAYVFAGDVVEAHHAAVRVAATHYCTPTFKDADIVVSNSYPLSTQPYARAWIGRSLRQGGTGVLIMQYPPGSGRIHYESERWQARSGGRTYFDRVRRSATGPARGNADMIVYSQYMDRQQMNGFGPQTIFTDKWEDVIRQLQARHKADARVAVYPYGGMQHEELELDG